MTLQRFRQRNPDYEREQHLRRTFGTGISDYDALLATQDGGCAICGRPPADAPLHVDHDHDTGQIRGLLCFRCNNALGLFRDSVEDLTMAAGYLASSEPELREIADLARQRARELTTSSV